MKSSITQITTEKNKINPTLEKINNKKVNSRGRGGGSAGLGYVGTQQVWSHKPGVHRGAQGDRDAIKAPVKRESTLPGTVQSAGKGHAIRPTDW